jgi:hypothetical protein
MKLHALHSAKSFSQSFSQSFSNLVLGHAKIRKLKTVIG